MTNQALLSSIAMTILLAGSPAESAVISYDNEADWLDAVETIFATEDFTGFAIDIALSEVAVPLAGGMAVRMFNPISSQNDFIDSANKRIAARVSGPGQAGAYIRVDFNSPVSAWGADVASFGSTTTVSVYDTDDKLLGQVVGGPDFRGFEVEGGDLAAYPTIARPDTLSDAIHINSMSTVPEPGTVFLVGLGLTAIGIQRRKRIR